MSPAPSRATVSVQYTPLEVEDGDEAPRHGRRASVRGSPGDRLDGRRRPTPSFAALVAWGDGTQTALLVEGDDGEFEVLGDHLYKDPGSYTAVITIYDGSNVAQTTCTVNVAPESSGSSPIDISVEDIAATAGEAIDDQLVATFSDDNPAHIGGPHTVTIDWGDQTTSAGTVEQGAGTDEYDVYGSHSYAVPGDYVIHVTVDDQSDSSSSSGVGDHRG